MYMQQGKQRTGTEEKGAASPLQPHQRVDQQTGDRHANPPCKGAEPLRGSSGRGSCAGTKKETRGEQYNCDKTTPNPMRNHHRRSRAANLSQPAGEPQKGSQLHDTECKKLPVYQDKLNRHTKEAQQERMSSRAGGGRRYSTAATEIKFSQGKNNRDHQRRWAAAQTPKASHQRREREENRQAEQRRQHQKGSPGIKAKIPKMNRN